MRNMKLPMEDAQDRRSHRPPLTPGRPSRAAPVCIRLLLGTKGSTKKCKPRVPFTPQSLSCPPHDPAELSLPE